MNPIRTLRDAKGWTQAELADRMGTRQQQISLWENAPEMLRLHKKSQERIAAVFGLNYIGLLMERRKEDRND